MTRRLRDSRDTAVDSLVTHIEHLQRMLNTFGWHLTPEQQRRARDGHDRLGRVIEGEVVKDLEHGVAT